MRLIPSDPDVETIVSRIESGDIDLQPEFQRGEVWGKTKKQRLIEVAYDYVTLFDVYECAINPELLENRIHEAEPTLQSRSYCVVTAHAFLDHPDLERFGFSPRTS